MCCYASKIDKHIFLADMKKRRRKTFTAWKVSPHNGKSAFGIPDYYYHPGVNYAMDCKNKRWRGKYSIVFPRGLHCFLKRRDAVDYKEKTPPEECGTNERVIPVQCRVDDLVVIGDGEIVMRKVTILKKDWPKKWKVQK